MPVLKGIANPYKFSVGINSRDKSAVTFNIQRDQSTWILECHRFSPSRVPFHVIRFRLFLRFYNFACCITINKVWAVEHAFALRRDEYLYLLLLGWVGSHYRRYQTEKGDGDGR